MKNEYFEVKKWPKKLGQRWVVYVQGKIVFYGTKAEVDLFCK